MSKEDRNSTSISAGESHSQSHFRYSTVLGYFQQSAPSQDANGKDSTIDHVQSNFGLIDRSYDTDAEFDPTRSKSQWERFQHWVRTLNARQSQSDSRIIYKVLFLGRHGQGEHNVAEAYYGTDAWDCYWSLREGNESSTWADARLTETGRAQARATHEAWRTEIDRGMLLPESFYVSPLNRCLETAWITFHGLVGDAFSPVVMENLRETIGIHTCDRRSNRSAIQSEYPSYRIEDGFAEDDPLWDPELRESDSARDVRLKSALDAIFSHDAAEFVSVTAHSGAITSILSVVGHRPFRLATGAVLPVFVRAEVVPGPEPPRNIDPPTRVPECKGDPLKAGDGKIMARVTEIPN